MQGVVDLQLMENASRTWPGDRMFVKGLEKAISTDLVQEGMVSPVELELWRVRKRGVKGTMETMNGVFDARPLTKEMVEYCVGDVSYLPLLHAVYLRKIRVGWLGQVVVESSRRVNEAILALPRAEGRERARGPWGGCPSPL